MITSSLLHLERLQHGDWVKIGISYPDTAVTLAALRERKASMEKNYKGSNFGIRRVTTRVHEEVVPDIEESTLEYRWFRAKVKRFAPDEYETRDFLILVPNTGSWSDVYRAATLELERRGYIIAGITDHASKQEYL